MSFFKLSGKAQIPVAILGTLFLSGLSLYKTSYASVLQHISTVAKLIPNFPRSRSRC